MGQRERTSKRTPEPAVDCLGAALDCVLEVEDMVITDVGDTIVENCHNNLNRNLDDDDDDDASAPSDASVAPTGAPSGLLEYQASTPDDANTRDMSSFGPKQHPHQGQGRRAGDRDPMPWFDDNGKEKYTTAFNPLWTYLTEGVLHKVIQKVVVTLGSHAARNPLCYVFYIAFFSIAIAGIGIFTNFNTEFDQRVFLTPFNSYPDVHSKWIYEDSGFEKQRVLWLALHSKGDNVLHAQAIRQALVTMETVKSAPDYDKVCSRSQFRSFDTNKPTCRVFTVTQFWDDNVTLFDEQMELLDQAADRDEFVRDLVSMSVFPDETPVFHEIILGRYTNTGGPIPAVNANSNFTDIRENAGQEPWQIMEAKSLVIKIDIPDLGDDSDPLEDQLLESLADLKRKFDTEPQKYGDHEVHLEYFTLNAYQKEFQRAMNQDLPLVFVLAVVMMSFTCFVFYRHGEKVKSRGLLGLFSFATIGLSLITGYGIMFTAGVPLTSVGIMIPFVVVGIALDDTFIITGAFFRNMRASNAGDDIVVIIEETLEEVSVSISMTTITTLICFIVGSGSTIPAVRWLCFYSATTIAVDFFYQVTFFIALLTLDERRVQANRRDFCFWIVVQDEESEAGETDEEEAPKDADRLGFDDVDIDAQSRDEVLHEQPVEGTEVQAIPRHSHKVTQADPAAASDPSQIHHELDHNFVERFMVWYADRLLRPWVKALVIFVFAAYYLGCVYSTTLLHQEFNVGDYVPTDSFLTSFMESFKTLTTVQRYVGVYFRNVDQTDPSIQEQMANYVQELSEMPQIGETAPFFWARDFEQIATSELAVQFGENLGIDIANLTFNEQLDFALGLPPIRNIYAQDIVRDEVSGNITASRTNLFLRKVDMYDIQDQIATLQLQRDITLSQPINQIGDELSFFTFDDMYFFWELYSTVVDELLFSTITCVVVVSGVTFVMIPHWSAVAFVLPLIIMLYFDLLGTMQYCGITINPISYFIIVMAIGLLVDFLMHILLRYYESEGKTRHEKVKDTLVEMGSSIFCGGFTTWLGVLPLAFSTTKTFMTVFVSFLAMVTLGIAFGLALLPVLLSIVGPLGRQTYGGIPKSDKHPTADDTWEWENFEGDGIRLYDGEIILEQVVVPRQRSLDVTEIS